MQKFSAIALGLLLSMAYAMPAAACSPDATCSHGLAMWGEPKYTEGFTHFDYTNPDAPKGGRVKLGVIGTFDNLNDHILKGVQAAGIDLIYDRLIEPSDDESFTKYGLLAETIELAKDRTWVAYHLRPQAKWHDGVPVTAEDVVWSFNTLIEKGHPMYRSYYREVTKVEALDAKTVKFTFLNGTNRELPLILGQVPILPKHYYTDGKHKFEETTLEPPLGSGPYKIEMAEQGKWVRFKRVEDYWGKDLPVNKGRFNFDTITYDYYRDETVAIEALKAGEFDLRDENVAKNWATAYEGLPAIADGRMIKETITHERPTGIQAFVLNQRKPMFTDIALRKALQYTLDFEWTNKHLFYGQYVRDTSYFNNSEFEAKGLPEGKELEVLEPFRDKLPPELFTTPFSVPVTDGTGNNREQLLAAKKLLDDAGYTIEKGALISPVTKQPVTLEFLLQTPTYERIAAPMVQNLKKLGIVASIRTVDSAQYIKRLENFDFDIVLHSFPESLSPGNEQEDYWSSKAAEIPGSRNMIGVKSEVVNALVQKIITATDKESLVADTRALDRVLLHSYYVIPNWHINYFRLIYWNRFGRPEQRQKYLLGTDTWWVDAEKDKKLNLNR